MVPRSVRIALGKSQKSAPKLAKKVLKLSKSASNLEIVLKSCQKSWKHSL